MRAPRTGSLQVVTGGLAAAVLVAAVSAVGVVHPGARRASFDRASTSYRGVLGLGDSVTAAAACSCASFVSRLGTDLEAREGTPVHVVNAGVNGLTSLDLLKQVEQSGARAVPGTITAIAIGANDFDPALLSRPDSYRTALTSLAKNLDGLLSLLREGPAASGPILVLGYWNVFLDGAAAAEKGPEYERGSDALTRAVNAVLSRGASSHAAAYVDLYAAFKREGDDSALLADDGDHPSDAGHALIATLLVQALGLSPGRHGLLTP